MKSLRSERIGLDRVRYIPRIRKVTRISRKNRHPARNHFDVDRNIIIHRKEKSLMRPLRGRLKTLYLAQL